MRFIACLLYVLCNSCLLIAQQPSNYPSPTQPDVVRINAELVQSSVMVFDKQGHFVDGLQREQFALLINGQPKAISFFERVTAGNPDEVQKYQAARKASSPGSQPVSNPAFSGRTLIFFIDDLHMSSESVNRTRTALLHFVDNSMGQDDRVAVTTASGQIGFLQQLTDNPDVLHAAVERLKYRQQFERDTTQRPPMDAYQAISILSGDEKILRYFEEMVWDDLLKTQLKGAMLTKNQAAEQQRRAEMVGNQTTATVKDRAGMIARQYSAITSSTLESLTNLMRSTAQLPRSKLVFVISDGFFINRAAISEQDRLQNASDAAVRSGAIIYSIQASGLAHAFADASTDARGAGGFEHGTVTGEDLAKQAGLYALAADSGGRSFFNSNSIDDGVKQALRETSDYYLLAWRPEDATQHPGAFRHIQVSVKDHPEWTVHAQKGYRPFSTKDSSIAKGVPTPARAQPDDKAQLPEAMRVALTAVYPITDLPVSVAVNFLDTPKEGSHVMIVTEVSAGASSPGLTDDKQSAIDLVGVVFNDEGKPVSSFQGQLKPDKAAAMGSPERTVLQVAQVPLKPGLYQVRVAARDEDAGRTGSAAQWILVPDLAAGRVALSSIFIGDLTRDAKGSAKPDFDQKARLRVNLRFSHDSRLRLLTYIYGSAHSQASPPKVTIQVRIVRSDQVIFTSPLVSVATEGLDDLSRIPYAAEISLRTLPSGRYALVVTTTDTVTKQTATQRAKFLLE